MARRRGLPAVDLETRIGAWPRDEVAGTAVRNDAAGKGRIRGWASPARVGMAAVGTVLAGVAIVGAVSPSPVVGGAGPSAAASDVAASTAASSMVGAAWGGAGGLDLLDLITKGTLVLILLFITLRVLGRMQASGPRRAGTNLSVLESRTLASKASLHLVAIGDRRLVVGLTPNGMVALAELDAAELEGARAQEPLGGEPETLPTPTGQDAAARPSHPAAGPAPMPFGATLNSLMAPIDGLTDRLAGFFNGGRAR